MNAVVAQPLAIAPEIIAAIVTTGDLKGLNDRQRVEYYNYRCQQAEVDPAAKPFDLLSLNNKLVLYANATLTQQLCNNRKLTVQIVQRDKVDEIYVVMARVTSPDGRGTDNMGAVPIKGLAGDGLANALMKATTKAIRRTVLAHCGLGMLDETEVETIPGALKVSPHSDTSEVDPNLAEKIADAFRVQMNVNNDRGVYQVHLDASQEGEEAYDAAWKLLKSGERATIKRIIDDQKAKF